MYICMLQIKEFVVNYQTNSINFLTNENEITGMTLTSSIKVKLLIQILGQSLLAMKTTHFSTRYKKKLKFVTKLY